MYKGASSNLQRANRVNRPLPTGGMIGLGLDADSIPSADNMGLEDCRREHRQLGVELARLNNEMLVAKRGQSLSDIRDIGLKMQTLIQRRSVINKRLRSLEEEARKDDPSEVLAMAIRSVAPEEMQREIFKMARAINKERKA